MSRPGPYSIGKGSSSVDSSIRNPELEMTLAELGKSCFSEKGKGIGKKGKGVGKGNGSGKGVSTKGNKTKGKLWEAFMQEVGLEETEDGIVALCEDDCQVGSDRNLKSAWSKYLKSHA